MAGKRGRPADPLSPYRMKVHRLGQHAYASTQPAVVDETTGKKRYRHVHWGVLGDGLRFVPNAKFLLLDPEERSRFIYPDTWDLSELQALPSHRSVGRPKYVEADRDRLYGDVWLMEQVAQRLGLLKDLETVFGGNREKARDVLSLAMYAYLTKQAYSRMAQWQDITRFPAVHKLTPSAITVLTQSITEQDRMALFRCRRARLGKGRLCALDSTTRSAEGHTLSDIRLGKSKEGGFRQQTTEVVVYSLDTHEPIYYRTFPGNMKDSKSLRVILSDLKHAGIMDVILVTDRGYECARSIDQCIVARQALVTAANIRQKFILKRIRAIGNVDSFDPEGMTWLPEQKLYARQYDLELELRSRGGRTVTSDRLKLNLYFDPRRRSEEQVALREVLHDQQTKLQHLQEAGTAVPDGKLREFPYFHVKRNEETHAVESFEQNRKKIQNICSAFGFFANMTLGVDYSAEKALSVYHLRDEQEKYFNDMKTRLHADRQHRWTEAGMRGIRFIEFVALIMVSYIKHVWRTSDVLRSRFPYLFAILLEMRTIHCIEHTSHTKVVTPFVGKQLDVCREFGFELPADCAPIYVRVHPPKDVATAE